MIAPWFVAKDVCDILELKNYSSSLALLDVDERGYARRVDLGLKPRKLIVTVNVVKDDHGNPWWVAKEVCDILGFRDTFNGTRYLDEDEVSTLPSNLEGQVRHLKIISEPGLYRMIMRSRVPVAKQFQRWVTHEVLPQIRATGGYIPIGADETQEEVLARAGILR